MTPCGTEIDQTRNDYGLLIDKKSKNSLSKYRIGWDINRLHENKSKVEWKKSVIPLKVFLNVMKKRFNGAQIGPKVGPKKEFSWKNNTK